MFTARTMFPVHVHIVHGAHFEVSQPLQRSQAQARGSTVEGLPRKCTINHFRMLHFVRTLYNHIKSNPCKFPNLFFEVSIIS